MRHARRKTLATLAAAATVIAGLVVAPPAQAATATIVASPTGSGNSCSTSTPCSLEGAQNKARGASQAGDAAEVILQGGQYALTSTMVFDASDSGTESNPVVYKAAPGETPVLTSGRALTGWSDAGGGVLSASTAGLSFRQLYVDGLRATPARFPNVGSHVQIQGVDRNAKTLSFLSEQTNTFGAADLSQIDLVAQLSWGETYARLKSATVNGILTNLTLQDEEADILFPRPNPGMGAGNAVHFENAREFLDLPGEFFVDRKAERVYYMPRPGENVGSTFRVPTLDTLIDIQGTKSAPVHDVRFEGITFEETGWNRPTTNGYLNAQGGLYNVAAYANNDQYSARPPAAVQANWSDRLAFTGNTFRKIGSTALDLDTGVHDSTVIGNVISDVAGNGVMVGKFSDPSVEYHTPYNPSDIDEVTARVTIANNVITGTGQVYYGTAGVNGGYIRDTSIVHNDISDSPWAGISTGWGWTNTKTAQENNQISYNRIANVVNMLCDTAGIYHLSNDPGTVMEGNYIHDVRRIGEGCIYSYSGFYLDEGSDNMTVRNNVLLDLDNKIYRNRNGSNVQFSNNDSEDKGIIQNAGLEPQYRGLLSRINLAAGKPTSASSVFEASAGDANVVDGNADTGWSAASNDTAAWWQVDLGASQTIDQVSVTTRQNINQPETRRGFEVRGSNDPNFGTYTVLAKRDSQTIADAGMFTAATRNSGQYRYLRVAKTDGQYFWISEFSAQGNGGVAWTADVPVFDQSTPWTLINVNSGLAADIAGASTADGARLTQYTPNGQANQQWFIRPTSGNLFTLVNVNSGKLLDNFASDERGNPSGQWTANGSRNQLWIIEQVGPDTYELRSQFSNQILEVGGGSTQLGAAVTQWYDNTQNNQRWRILPVNQAVITPAASPAANEAGWNSTPVDLTFATEAAGVTVETREAGTQTWSDVQPVTVASQGVTTVEYRGIREGSVAAGSTGSTVVKVDTVAPASSATTDPESGSAPEGQQITARFSASDATSGVALTEYTIDGGATWAPATDDGVSFTAAGTHVVQYRSVDAAGNVESPKSVTLTVVAPQNVAKATITSSDEPSADGWYQQNVLVKLVAPGSGQKIQYRINGGSWKSYSSSINVTASGATKIDHRLLESNVVIAGSESQVQVKIDKTVPTASAVRSPSSGVGSPRNPITVTFAAKDTHSGVGSIEYRINSGEWAPATSEPVTFGAVGDYVVTYRATDLAGNTSQTKSLSFSIAENVATSLKASASSVKAGSTVTLTLRGYVRWDDVTVVLGDRVISTLITDANGAARVTVRIPIDAPAGTAQLVATGSDSSVTAATSIKITR